LLSFTVVIAGNFLEWCRALIKSIHDYQRHGGLSRQLEQIDRAVTDYFVIPSSTSASNEQTPRVGGGKGGHHPLASDGAASKGQADDHAPLASLPETSVRLDEQ
jgi:hypothetical protein